MKLSDGGFLFLLLNSVISFAQFSKPDEPRPVAAEEVRAYLFPVNPGVPNSLAGTMGELRNTHFHAGIDIRTNNMTGVPIRATQKGYVSRISVSAFGYGKAMFIKHPDGNTSVYGHLDGFRGDVAKYVLQQHYQRKLFELELDFEPGQFPVEQGDTIAVSGNTGGSNGAHLHFEIRDENNLALNPLRFGFEEIKDNLAPIAQKIALKTFDANARINDRFGRFEFNLVRKGDSYSLPFPILANGRIVLELLAYDKIDQTPFKTGINSIEGYADGTLFFSQQIDKINFDDSRGILAVMDYEALKEKGARYNKLYVDDGNPLDFYPLAEKRGWLAITSKDVNVVIKLKDFSGHESTVSFTLKASPVSQQVSTMSGKLSAPDYDVVDNTLRVSSNLTSNNQLATIFSKEKETKLAPAYQSALRGVYLFDLRQALPDSIQVPGGTIKFNFVARIPAGTDYTYYSNAVDIQFPKGALYDTLFLTVKQKADSGARSITIGSPYPLHRAIEVTAKNLAVNPTDIKQALYRKDGSRLSFVPSVIKNGGIQFSTRDFGEFVLLRDTIAPAITKQYCTAAYARFRIRDNLSGISYFEASVNGEWLLMHYDYKTGLLQSEKLDRKKPLSGDFVLKVVDMVGNEKIFKQRVQ